MEELIIFFVIVLLIISIMNIIKRNKDIIYVKSKSDGRKYLVRTLSDSQEASEKLAELNIKIKKIIDKSLTNKDHPTVDRLNRYNPDTLSETIPGSKYTSYSVNKGESIAICLRHKDNSFMEWNTIIFVTLHEIAHILTVEEQHPPIFWTNMKFLLEQAEEIGLYVPVDYSKTPKEYCGIQISSTPYEFVKVYN